MSNVSPSKPSAKQTILPNSDIKNLLLKKDPSQQSFNNLIQNDPTLDATLNNYKYVEHPKKYSPLTRLPTLYEILNRRTQSPVDLWSFYIYIRDYQNSVDYLDFWIDVVTHLRLCKDYVKGLRESLLLSERHKSLNDEKYNSSSGQNKTSSSDENKKTDTDNVEGDDTRDHHRESVNSSLLLEALLNEGFLDDSDNRRVSSFLQGNEYINISDQRINAIFNRDSTNEEKVLSQGEKTQSNIPLDPYEPLSSPQKVFAGDIIGRNSNQHHNHDRNSTRILPEQLEKYTMNIKNGNINRETLKSSSRNILNTYFKESSPKKLIIPDRIVRKIRHDIEIQGRDDPEVFEDAKNYVYSAMERESLPFFLQQNALHNLGDRSSIYRLILGFLAFFIGFWISYSLIFIDIKPKAIRAVLIVPFFIGSYFLISYLYKLDPILVFLRISDNQQLSYPNQSTSKNDGHSKVWIKNLNEPYVWDLLKKRSVWVLFLILLLTAILSVLFGLVPGHRI